MSSREGNSPDRTTSSQKIKLLTVCSDYKGTNIYLPGVGVDYLNLYQFTTNTTLACTLLNNPSKTQIYEHLPTANIVWMCGHGVLDKTENVYLLADSLPSRVPPSVSLLAAANRLTEGEFTRIIKQHRRAHSVLICVFDFCHSCTMLDLEYYYEGGFFYKKVSSANFTTSRDDPFIITISGCPDSETTEEDRKGGVLTQKLLFLLRREKRLTLELLDSITHKSCISVNRPIDPNFVFAQF